MSTENEYKFINYLKGQQLKAEDVNRIQKWLEKVEDSVIPERISINGGGVPGEDDANASNYKIHIDENSSTLYFKGSNDSWQSTIPCVLKDNVSAQFYLKSRREVAQFLYSSFKNSSGNYQIGQYVTSGTTISKNSTGYSSGLLRIKPKANFYVGYVEDTNNIGCFFNSLGEPLKIVTSSDIVKTVTSDDETKLPILYQIKNDSLDYEYFCYNLASDTNKESRYRQFVTSKNLLSLEDSGNYLIYEDDPVYQRKKDKNLLVVGASGVSRDRNCSFGEGGEGVDGNSPKVSIGFQEYLKLWYKTVQSKGYSGKSWRPDKKNSIPRQLMHSGVDFKNYDDYLFIPSTSGISGSITCFVTETKRNFDTTLKLAKKTSTNTYAPFYHYDFYFPALGKYTDILSKSIPDKNGKNVAELGNTYFEGLNSTIKEIREARKGMVTNIYVANGAKKSYKYYNSEAKKTSQTTQLTKKNYENNQETYLIINELNRLLPLACAEYSYALIDLAEAGFCKENYESCTVEDNNHLNNIGNRMQGLAIRKQIIGI